MKLDPSAAKSVRSGADATRFIPGSFTFVAIRRSPNIHGSVTIAWRGSETSGTRQTLHFAAILAAVRHLTFPETGRHSLNDTKSRGRNILTLSRKSPRVLLLLADLVRYSGKMADEDRVCLFVFRILTYYAVESHVASEEHDVGDILVDCSGSHDLLPSGRPSQAATS